MIDSEAIKELQDNIDLPFGVTVSDESSRMAIKALEKQMPKKPRFYAHNYYCSICDSLVGNNEFEWKRFKYCDTCGQHLDWSDEE